MIKIILLTLGIVFAMLGLAEFFHSLKLILTVPKTKAVTYSIVFLCGENPLQQMIYAAEQAAWLGKSYADSIIAINSGLSTEDDNACRYAAEKFGIIYCTSDELQNQLGAILKYNI